MHATVKEGQCKTDQDKTIDQNAEPGWRVQINCQTATRIEEAKEDGGGWVDGWMDGGAMHGCEGEALLSACVRSSPLCAVDGPSLTQTALAVHGTVKAQHECCTRR